MAASYFNIKNPHYLKDRDLVFVNSYRTPKQKFLDHLREFNLERKYIMRLLCYLALEMSALGRHNDADILMEIFIRMDIEPRNIGFGEIKNKKWVYVSRKMRRPTPF